MSHTRTHIITYIHTYYDIGMYMHNPNENKVMIIKKKVIYIAICV